VTKGRRAAGTLDSGDRPADTLRLFLALLLPQDVADALLHWRDSQLLSGHSGPKLRPVDDVHVTLAFLGTRPRSDVAPVVGALQDSAAEAAAFELVPKLYRETSSVGMVVLDDPSGEAGRFAERLHGRLEGLDVYERETRPWLPHATVVRFTDRRRDRRRDRPGLFSKSPEIGAFAPSEAAAFLSRLHPSGARYEILERCPLGGRVYES